jgi:hypothetical protein
MALNVLGDPLVFEASIDTSKLEKDLQDGLNAGTAQVQSYNEELRKSAAAASSAFSPDVVNGFLNAIRKAAGEITPLLKKGVDGFDTTKLNALADEVDSAKDEFERLNVVIKFISDNINNLKLSPDEISQLASSIKVVSDNFAQLKATEGSALSSLRDIKSELGDQGTPSFITGLLSGLDESSARLKLFNQDLLSTDASKAFDPAGLDQFISSIQAASQQIGTLFQKGAQTLDPTALADLEHQLQSTTDSFEKLKIVSGFVKDNIGSFSLSDSDVKVLSQAVGNLDTSFAAAAGNEQTVFEKLQLINGEMGKLVQQSGSGAGIPVFIAAFLDGLDQSSKNLEEFNQELLKTDTSRAFDPAQMDQFINSVGTASQEIVNLFSKVGAGLDPSLLSGLEQQLQSTTDSFEKLKIVSGFVKDNLGSFSLSDTEVATLSQAVDTLDTSFASAAGNGQTVFERLQLINGEMGKLSQQAGANSGVPAFISSFLEGLDESSAKLQVFNKELLSTDTSKAFDPTQMNEFIGSVGTASQAIGDLFSKVGVGIDPSVLAGLEQQLNTTTDDFEKLRIVSDFVKQNLNNFSLNDADIKSVSAAVDTLDSSFSAAAGSGQTVAQKLKEISKLAPTAGKAFDSTSIKQFVSTVTQASAKVTTLLQKGLKGLDPSILTGLQNELDTTVDEFKRLQIITDFIKKNIGQLNLSDDEVKQLAGAVTLVEKSFGKVSDKEETVKSRLLEIKNELANMAANRVDKASPEFQQRLKEATELEQAIKGVNKQVKLTGSETSSLDALRQGFQGLIGVAEAAGGIIGFFSDDEAKAQVVTKNLVALMATLNGIREVGDIISKKSALNEFLLAKYRQLTATSTASAAVSQAALTGAQEGGVVATEAATTAQVELNAALLANPVAIILGSVIALYGAYSILANTVFRASNAQIQEKAARESLAEAQRQATKSIADEEVNMLALIGTAKNANLSYRERQGALNELRKTYPEHLSNLTLESLYTKQVSDAIQLQIGLIKKKAEAAAIEEILKQKFKEQLDAQLKIGEVQERLIRLYGKEGFERRKATGNVIQLINAQHDYERKVAETNGTFEKFTGLQDEAQKETGKTTGAVDRLITNLEKLQSLAGDKNIFDGFIQGFKKVQAGVDKVKPFNAKDFDDRKASILAEAQFRVDTAKKGSAQELQARKDLLKKEQQLLQEQIAGNDQRVVFDIKTGALTPEGVAETAKVVSGLQEISQQATERFLKNVTDTADAIVIALTRAGQQGSDAYFEAQRVAIKKAADAEIVAANDNSGTIKKIKAQLALDLHNLDIEQQRQALENEKSLLQARLNAIKIGSAQELDIRLEMLDIAAKEELLQAGKNKDKILEITSTSEKEKADLRKQFQLQNEERGTNILLSNIEDQLSTIRTGTEEEVKLKKQAIAEKADLDIISAKGQIKNAQELQAKIKEIKSKSLKEQRDLDDDFFRNLLQKQLDFIQSQADFATIKLDNTINNPKSSSRTRQKAEQDKLKIDLEATQKELEKTIEARGKVQGDADDLNKQITDLVKKVEKLQGDINNTTIKTQAEILGSVSQKLNSLSSSFSTLSGSLKDINPQLAATLSQMGNLAGEASDLFDAFKSFQNPDDIAAGIGSVVSAVSKIIEDFAQVSKSKKQAQQDVIDFQTAILTGEETYNEILRERARQQVLINKLTLDGLRDQKKLLEEQKKINQDSFDDILKKLQQEQFIVSEGTKKKLGGPLQGLIGLFSGARTEVTQQLQGLAGKSFDEIEKLFNTGQLTDKAKALFEQLQRIKQEGLDIDALLAENAQKFKESLTGTTADSIIDSIVEGFKQGKHEAGDFADNFRQLMQDAIIQSLKFKVLEGPIKEFFNKFADLTDSGDQLTADEVANLQNTFNDIIENANSQFEQLQQIAGINFNGQLNQGNSLTGAIKGMTEQQAELLAGQFGGLRLTALDQLNLARQGLLVLNDIQVNTGLTVVRLSSLLTKFDAYETGAKKLKVEL